MRRLLAFFGLDHDAADEDFVLDGTLHVGPEARVDASITARVIVIAGVVRA